MLSITNLDAFYVFGTNKSPSNLNKYKFANNFMTPNDEKYLTNSTALISLKDNYNENFRSACEDFNIFKPK